MRNWQILLASLLLISAVSARVCAQAAEPTPAQSQAQSNAHVESKTSEAAAPTQSESVWANKLARWFEVQAATITLRYHFVESAQGVTTANQVQDQDVFKARLKFDAGGRFSLNAGVASGTQFVASWNNTGVGTGRLVTNLYLKQLYFAAQLLRGVELQYGGLGILRGEASEITSYDNDGFVTGQRIILRQPQQFFFDEVAVTYAYFGELDQPGINKRFHRLKQSNYHQFLVSKKLGERAAVSADYTFQAGIETLRQAVKFNLPEVRVVDSVRFENYQRLDVEPAYGFAVTGEKKLSSRLTTTGGYAQIDQHYGGLNSDRFNFGKRVYLTGAFALCSDLTVSTFLTHTVGDRRLSSHRARFDVLFTYDLLKSLKRIGIV